MAIDFEYFKKTWPAFFIIGILVFLFLKMMWLKVSKHKFDDIFYLVGLGIIVCVTWVGGTFLLGKVFFLWAALVFASIALVWMDNENVRKWPKWDYLLSAWVLSLGLVIGAFYLFKQFWPTMRGPRFYVSLIIVLVWFYVDSLLKKFFKRKHAKTN